MYLFSSVNRRKKLPDSACKEKFGLNRIEVRQLRKHFPLLYEHFPPVFCIDETIRFYLRVFRDLPPEMKKDFMLNRYLMQYCIYLIKATYDFKPAGADQLSACRTSFLPGNVTLIEKHAESIAPLSNEAEKILFAHDHQRWKRKFNQITQAFDINNPDDFYENITRLASFNKNVRLTDTRNIFYKSYLFMIEYHPITSLKLYLHYLSVKSVSDTFKYKQISARNASKLFGGNERQQRFETVSNQFQKDGDLEKALAAIGELYIPVRRKIKLNAGSIQEARNRQASVAKILGAYLDDDPVVDAHENIQPEVIINTADNNRQALFDLFISHAFRLNQQEINKFVHSKGLFKDPFIEGINEQYYEILDDLLIEQEGDEYILNKTYYQEAVKEE